MTISESEVLAVILSSMEALAARNAADIALGCRSLVAVTAGIADALPLDVFDYPGGRETRLAFIQHLMKRTERLLAEGNRDASPEPSDQAPAEPVAPAPLTDVQQRLMDRIAPWLNGPPTDIEWVFGSPDFPAPASSSDPPCPCDPGRAPDRLSDRTARRLPNMKIVRVYDHPPKFPDDFVAMRVLVVAGCVRPENRPLTRSQSLNALEDDLERWGYIKIKRPANAAEKLVSLWRDGKGAGR